MGSCIVGYKNYKIGSNSFNLNCEWAGSWGVGRGVYSNVGFSFLGWEFSCLIMTLFKLFLRFWFSFRII